MSSSENRSSTGQGMGGASSVLTPRQGMEGMLSAPLGFFNHLNCQEGEVEESRHKTGGGDPASPSVLVCPSPSAPPPPSLFPSFPPSSPPCFLPPPFLLLFQLLSSFLLEGLKQGLAYVLQSGLELTVSPLPPPPGCWDDRGAPAGPVPSHFLFFFFSFLLFLVLGIKSRALYKLPMPSNPDIYPAPV